MSFSKRIAIMLIPLAAACGGNVVVDGAGGAHGTSSTGSTVVTTEGCTSDADCAAGELCDLKSETCVGTTSPSCVADSDCATGEVCDVSTGFCEPATGSSCHQCACVDTLTEGGCANVCDGKQNGTGTPNFCNGVSALTQCATCLLNNCGVAVPNDPTACN